MKRTTILGAFVLLLMPTLTIAQTKEAPSPSENGWVFGVGLYGGYEPLSSPDLDDTFSAHSFPGEEVPSILFGSRVVFGFPILQIGVGVNYFFPHQDVLIVEDAGTERSRRTESERSNLELTLGLPIRRPHYTVTPAFGLGFEQIDVSITEQVGADGPFSDPTTLDLYHDELDIVILQPQAVVNIPLAERLSLEVIGGYAIPISTSSSNRPQPAPGIDPSFTVRVGLFINAVDYLAKVPW